MVKNLLYNAGDVDSVPVWRTKIPQAVGQLSRSSRALVQPNKWMNIFKKKRKERGDEEDLAIREEVKRQLGRRHLSKCLQESYI